MNILEKKAGAAPAARSASRWPGLLPLAVFVLVLALHALYIRHVAAVPVDGFADDGISDPGFLGLGPYLAAQDYFLGFSYALGAAFATWAGGQFLRQRRAALAAGAVGSIGLVGVLMAGGCFLLGCCGSPMLGVYLALFGTKALGAGKPLMVGITLLSTGCGYWCLSRRFAKSGGTCCESPTCPPSGGESQLTNSANPATAPARDMQTALRLEVITIGWMIVEAAASIGAGVMAGSVLLLAFGVDSIIELISAGVLFHRLRSETSGAQNAEAIETLERRASRIAGCLLFTLAAYVVLQSGYGLLHRHMAETSWLGLAVALVAALGMPVLARAKIRAADRIRSKALRADAMETFTCGFLSWVLLAGLAATALLHWWWLDSVAALVLVPFLVKEGREAIAGECGCGPSCHSG